MLQVFEYKEFLKLEVEELNLFIKSDGIVVSNEEFVFKVVKEWLLFDRTNRDRHMVTLLENVKLPLLSLTVFKFVIYSIFTNTKLALIFFAPSFYLTKFSPFVVPLPNAKS